MPDTLLEALLWVEDGAYPKDQRAPSFDMLQKMEHDDLVRLTPVECFGESKPRLMVNMTGLGQYELTRLEFKRDNPF